MRIYEIYPRVSKRIQIEDLSDFEEPLTIKDVEVSGESKKTVWLSFDQTNLKHKCSKSDVFNMAKELNTNDTDSFVGQHVNLIEENDKVVVEIAKKKK